MSTLIIAEAGVNHNGDLSMALELVNVASEAGADIVKFQTFKADNLVTKTAQKADYQLHQTSESESHYEMLKKLELTERMHIELLKKSNDLNIEFCSTPFDLESLQYLIELGIQRIKIPSGEITNLPYLRKIGSSGKPIVLSTGMSTIQEIGDAIDVLQDSGASKDSITVLHCNTEYPIPMDEVNLRAIKTIQDTFGVSVGFSDHTKGIEASIAAVALGAEIIEKHFTLDRNLPGPDHQASIEPQELKQMVSSIRNISNAMGSGIKEPSNSERKNIPIARKSLVAAVAIKKGDIFDQSNISVKRPGTGISPMLIDDVLGKQATRDFAPDEIIEL